MRLIEAVAADKAKGCAWVNRVKYIVIDAEGENENCPK